MASGVSLTGNLAVQNPRGRGKQGLLGSPTERGPDYEHFVEKKSKREGKGCDGGDGRRLEQGEHSHRGVAKKGGRRNVGPEPGDDQQSEKKGESGKKIFPTSNATKKRKGPRMRKRNAKRRRRKISRWELLVENEEQNRWERQKSRAETKRKKGGLGHDRMRFARYVPNTRSQGPRKS